jgi:OCT family organic cation transporter-like MFS transporter 4/5
MSHEIEHCSQPVYLILSLGVELVGPGKRLFAGVVNEIFFAVGLVLLAGVAFGLRDWFWIELALSIPTVVFISFWW